MKQRLLVMNGQCIVQVEKEGGWVTQAVDKAGVLKPGVYNLYMAQQSDKKQSYDGVIVHADNSKVYQQVGKSFFMHDRSDFDKIPEIGGAKSISYSAQGKVVIAAEAPKIVRGRSR